MFRRRWIKRWTTWTAALAVLVGALMPTLSLAAGPAFTQGWAAVCSAQGEKWVRLDASDTAPEPAVPAKLHLLGPHCPYCSSHAAALGMPPPPTTVALGPATGQVAVEAAEAVPRACTRLRAQPRGPPFELQV